MDSEQRKKWEAMLDRIEVIDRRLAAWEDRRPKEKVVTFSEIVVGIFYLLRECVYLALQCATMAAWFAIWIVICLILGAGSCAKGANDRTSHGGSRKLAAPRSPAPVAGASGDGWSEIYEKLDLRAAKLLEKTASGKDDERHNRSDTGHVVPEAETPVGVSETRRRKEMAMSKYLHFIR